MKESETIETDTAWRDVAKTSDGRYLSNVHMREYAFAMLKHSLKMELQRNELMKILEKIDPGPEWQIDDSIHDGNAFCEISVGDMRKIRSTLANFKKSRS